VHDLALLFPSVRPTGTAIDAYAARLAAEMGDQPREPTAAEAAAGVELLPAGERARLILSWAGPYPARWRKICSAAGNEALAEQTLLASAVLGAVADRIVCAPTVVAELEEGALEGSPGAALAFAIAPQAVWSYEEVLSPGRPLVTNEHIARVRTQARRLRRRLPYDGLPRASATLARGCAIVADTAVAAGVAELLIDAYVITLRGRASYISRRN
jgi:hypothetical protein